MTDTFDAFAAGLVPTWVTPDVERNRVGAAARFYVRVVVVSFLVRWFIVEPRYIPSASMLPTFEIGDQLAVEKLSTLVRTPAANEVVLFRPPPQALQIEELRSLAISGGRGGSASLLAVQQASQERKKEVFIKRVIGVPGDVVEVRDSAVFVNGVRQKESFVNERPRYSWGPSTVPPDTLFVLGDNRNRSFDSHVWGFLPKENVIGHAILRYWPLARFGLIEH